MSPYWLYSPYWSAFTFNLRSLLFFFFFSLSLFAFMRCTFFARSTNLKSQFTNFPHLPRPDLCSHLSQRFLPRSYPSQFLSTSTGEKRSSAYWIRWYCNRSRTEHNEDIIALVKKCNIIDKVVFALSLNTASTSICQFGALWIGRVRGKIFISDFNEMSAIVYLRWL